MPDGALAEAAGRVDDHGAGGRRRGRGRGPGRPRRAERGGGADPAGSPGRGRPWSAGGLGTDTPPLRLGDRVDVLATFDVLDPTDGSGGAEPTGAVADGALVVDVSDDAVTVAVPATDAARVAFAVARGTVTLALVGAG